MDSVTRRLDLFVSAVLALSASGWLPLDAVKDVTTELIAFFSIQSAVILPAMIFTAGILRPDGLEMSDVLRYHKALKKQMVFWVTLLAFDFLAVASLITGKALGWSIMVVSFGKVATFDLAVLLCFSLYFFGALAVFRTIPFIRGVLSLLDLNSEMTQKATIRRNARDVADERNRSDSRPMVLPEGYGHTIDSIKREE